MDDLEEAIFTAEVINDAVAIIADTAKDYNIDMGEFDQNGREFLAKIFQKGMGYVLDKMPAPNN